MFQFPGFALLTLCIQVKSTWLTALLKPPCGGNNNEVSGGLPHSEIRGSKPILGSPRLIAEYHVLHRLLLPRHSPNALLALDLIQKKTCPFCTPPAFCLRTGPMQPPEGDGTEIKSILSRSAAWFVQRNFFAALRLLGLVYLTWSFMLSGSSPRPPAFGDRT